MRILLTNDDGIDAEGIHALEAALSRHHEVWVFAPDGERSGTSHSIHLRGPVSVHQHDLTHYSCSGTPADCVFLAWRGSFVPPFEAVLSGINHGPNLGTDMVYSGTCAAARQGALAGLPSVAVSLASFQAPLDFATGAQWVAEHWETLLSGCTPGAFVNINLPAKAVHPLKGVLATPSIRRYFDKVIEFTDPHGDRHCFVEGLIRDDDIPPQSDWALVREGRIAVSVVQAQPSGLAWTGGPL